MADLKPSHANRLLNEEVWVEVAVEVAEEERVEDNVVLRVV